jgi:glycosyltransferase involved in cell wall biosynthesis
MRIAVVDLYRPGGSVHKDPVTIPLGLAGLGHEPVLVSVDPSVDRPFALAGLPVRPLADLHPHGWAAAGFDAAIVISRFAPALGPVVAAVRAAGVPLVVKGDTDGTLGHPIPPNYLRARPPLASPANLLRHVKWRAPVGRWVRPRIAQIECADRVVVESPGAAGNVARVLVHWGCAGSADKVVFLPNQVSPAATARPVAGKPERLVVAAGRWEDVAIKGTDPLCRAVRTVVATRPGVRFVIAGSGGDEVARRLPAAGRDGVEIVGELPFDALQALFARARVLLVSSRVESFSLVTAEALCAGASVAVTPIEPLLWLSGGGEWGTVARDFSAAAIAAALIHEIDRWDRGDHDPAAIAAHWRERLAPDAVARRWDALLADLIGAGRGG